MLTLEPAKTLYDQIPALLAQLPAEPREIARRKLLSLLDVPEKLCTLRGQIGPACGADQVLVSAEPSELLLEIVTALRAGDVDRIDVFHGNASPGLSGEGYRGARGASNLATGG